MDQASRVKWTTRTQLLAAALGVSMVFSEPAGASIEDWVTASMRNNTEEVNAVLNIGDNPSQKKSVFVEGGEYRVADSSWSVNKYGLATEESLALEQEWNRVWATFVYHRANNPFFEGIIDEMEGYPLSDRHRLIRLIYGEDAEGGPNYDEGTIDFIREARIPQPLYEALKKELNWSMAVDFGFVEDYIKYIDNYRDTGRWGSSREVEELYNFAPEHTVMLPWIKTKEYLAQEAESVARIWEALGDLRAILEQKQGE